MRKLGEQWVEELDGKKHMYKCIGLNDDMSEIIKDLGILNEDGCLPCPFCGEYPTIIYPTKNMPVVAIVHTGEGHRILLEFFRNKQEAIDNWNRRA